MKLRYINALRGLAILAVIVVHCSLYGNNQYLPSIFKSVVWSGLHGVQLFYLVSAFTLFLSLDNRDGKEKSIWSKFFIRRFFRIAPMYYVGICYYLWQDGLGPRYWLADFDRITFSNIFSNFFFFHGFNPYWITSVVPGGWSIADEMLFYSLIPILFWQIKNVRQAYGFVLITLAIRLFLQITLNTFPLIASERLWDEYLFLYLPSQLPVFALGILFFHIVKSDYTFSLPPIFILITAIVLVVQFIGFPIGLPILPNHFLFSVAFLVLCIALSKKEFKILVNSLMIHLGKISYSMYVVHFAVLHWLIKFNIGDYLTVSNRYDSLLNYALRLLVVVIITSMISTVFYKLVELPMQAVGKRIIGRWVDSKNAHARNTQTRIEPLESVKV